MRHFSTVFKKDFPKEDVENKNYWLLLLRMRDHNYLCSEQLRNYMGSKLDCIEGSGSCPESTLGCWCPGGRVHRAVNLRRARERQHGFSDLEESSALLLIVSRDTESEFEEEWCAFLSFILQVPSMSLSWWLCDE